MPGGIGRAFGVARAALADEKARGRAARRRRDEIEFLPAAAEVIETPASPTARLTFWLLTGLLATAVACAFIGRLDVVAIADGRTIPAGRTKVIQALETSTVKAIRVADGQAVKAGDVLIELDPRATDADVRRLEGELLAARIEVARLTAAQSTDRPLDRFRPPPEAPAALVATQRALLLAQVDEQLSRLAAIDAEIAKRQAERRTVESGMKRLERALPLLRERADARNELAREGYGSRLLALEVSQQQIEMEQELQTMRHRREESAAALVALDRQRAQAGSEYLKQTFTALAEAERRVAATQEELAKAQQRQDLRNLTAPIDGVVQQLAVNTVGGVVTPAQALMVVVPAEADIEVEATLRNRDVGFVVPGQPVEVKLEAFQFTKYGGVPGRVVTVSRDAVPDERRGLVYPVRIALDRGTIDVDGRPQALTPGMALTAEIKTGDRRIIDYLMSPIVRYRDEAMRER